jgi:Fe-S-cluster containining protein
MSADASVVSSRDVKSYDVHYQCQRCTACCRWPGQVKVGEAELAAMAALLGMEEWAFIQKFTRLRPQRDGLALLDKENGECIFLEGRDCVVQDAKPIQCKGFPNTWNFPGWRSSCEAVPVLKSISTQSNVGADVGGGGS